MFQLIDCSFFAGVSGSYQLCADGLGGAIQGVASMGGW